MSDIDLSAAVEAAAEREWNRKNAPRTWASDITPPEATPALRKAKRYVTAAAPLIETAVRALVVAEIEAERDIDRAECEPGVCEFADEGDCHNDGRYTGFSLAAHVARGPR